MEGTDPERYFWHTMRGPPGRPKEEKNSPEKRFFLFANGNWSLRLSMVWEPLMGFSKEPPALVDIL